MFNATPFDFNFPISLPAAVLCMSYDSFGFF